MNQNQTESKPSHAEQTSGEGLPSIALLCLLADIRAAVGDPTGKLMQDELVAHCAEMLDRVTRAEIIVAKYRRALADAIRRPMGIIPDSADGLVDMDDLRAAELRRPKTTTLEMCCSNGWANKF